MQSKAPQTKAAECSTCVVVDDFDMWRVIGLHNTRGYHRPQHVRKRGRRRHKYKNKHLAKDEAARGRRWTTRCTATPPPCVLSASLVNTAATRRWCAAKSVQGRRTSVITTKNKTKPIKHREATNYSLNFVVRQKRLH
ncbi:hypothetical protein TRVL_08871 [Trypanosoma vivax]|nr:hypothetical protein TRVL_08871 [Trypanosoma vivax]